MANTITTKYGTKINVEGLNAEQIARVRAVAENKGAYGSKGASLAREFQKKNKRAGTTSTQTTQNQTDAGTKGLGETATNVDDFLASVFAGIDPSGIDLSGMPKILTDNDLQATRESVYNSLLESSTKDLEKDRGRAMEDTEQQLAERGIPINFESDPNNPDNLYARARGDVNSRFDTIKQDAMNAANIGADQRLTAMANVNKAAGDQFMTGAMTEFQSKLDAASTGGNILQQLMTKYGIDQQTAQAKIDAATRKYIANVAARRSGGGGGGTDTGANFNGVAPGFNV